MMQSDTEPKFCKDCKHYESPFVWTGGYFEADCRHHKNMSEPDLVSACRRPISTPAGLRKPEGACGVAGAMFEPKEPKPPLPPAPWGLRWLLDA